jgi:YVTN family beta-propeller protein
MPTVARLFAALGFAVLLTADTASAVPYLLATRPSAGAVVALDLGGLEAPRELAAGELPAGVASEAASGSFAVADALGNRLFVTRAGTVAQWGTAAGPAGVAFCAGGALLASVATGDGLLELFDVETATRRATVAVGAQPLALVCDGERAVVVGFGDDRVWLVDLATYLAQPVAVGAFPAGVALAAGRAWIANLGDDTVSVVDLASATVVATLPAGSAPRAVAAGGGRVYVADCNTPTIAVFDAVSTLPLATWTLAAGPAFDLAWSAPDRLYASHPGAESVSILDAASGASIGALAAPAGLTGLGGVVTTLGAPAVEIPTLHESGLTLLALAFAGIAWRRLGAKRRATPLLALALAMAGPPLAAGTVSFSDSTFADADWEVASAVVGNGGHSVAMSALDGDPPPSRRMSHNVAASSGSPEVVEVLHRFLGGGHDPATSGAIATISAAWDRVLFSADGVPEVGESFVLFQDGVAYRATSDNFSQSSWTPIERTALTAASFADGNGLHPDFSAGGAAISFGYSRRTVSGGTFAAFAAHGIDNFLVEVATGGAATLLAMADRLYLASGSDAVDLCALREGDGVGPVTVELRAGLGLAPDDVLPLAWGDGETGLRCAAYAPGGSSGAILRYRVQLANPTPSPGATIDSLRSRALLLYSSDAALGGVLALLGLLLAEVGPAALGLLTCAALAVAWLAARRASHQPNPAPAREA